MQQGVGLGDTKPIFNRHHLSLTRFQPLGRADTTSKAIPGSLVVHAGLGACVGDQPPYDLFALGGPLSVSTPTKACLSKAFIRAFVERGDVKPLKSGRLGGACRPGRLQGGAVTPYKFFALGGPFSGSIRTRACRGSEML